MPLPLAAAGGQGWPDAEVPGAVELPEVEGELELDEPALEEPEPVFGVELLGAPAVPGKVPQGEPLGVVPGAVVVFGFTVEGWVLPLALGGLVEFDPGTVDGDVGGFTDPVGGALGELVGGTVALVDVPGVRDCPADAALPVAGAPPAGAL